MDFENLENLIRFHRKKRAITKSAGKSCLNNFQKKKQRCRTFGNLKISVPISYFSNPSNAPVFVLKK